MRTLQITTIAVIMMFCISPNVLATTITISKDGTGDFTTIQDGIDAAVYGDTINVKAGTYIENITLKNGVAVIGEGADKCIINGGKNGPTVYSKNCDSLTSLKNFTVTNGSGYINQHGRTLGGGIYNNHSNITIRQCIFTGNSVEYGGGIYNDNRSNPEVSDCQFIDNIAEWWGGGIVNYHYCNPKILNCIFFDNLARYGGGIYNYNFCDAEIINCIFESNIATSDIYFSCGGGIYNDKESDSYIVNCLFIDNTVSDAGGGLYNRSSSPFVINCTFYGNWANIYGGAIGNFKACYPNILNSILWGNRANKEGDEVFNIDLSGYESSIPHFSYCNISNSGGTGIDWDGSIGIDGGNNIDIHPSFINPSEKDFRLLANSPCIDTGDPNSEFPHDTTDLGGNLRITNEIVDMGAYEFIHPVEVSVDIKPQSCPNPVNTKSKGVLPVVILGSDVLDINDIDYDSILLEGIAPLRGSYEDVASPVADNTECACTTNGADGYMDLTLKFKTQEIVAALGEVVDDELWMLHLTGNLKDGTPIEGTDCILIKKKGRK